MTPDERLEYIEKLRATLATTDRLRIEWLAETSKVLRAHSIDIDDEILGSLTIAITDELTEFSQTASIDPGSG